MQIDAFSESLRLAEEYRAKSDGELRELAADFADLTEPAQQALRVEMHSRRLGDPQVTREDSTAASGSTNEPAIFADADDYWELDRQGGEKDERREYTWKTLLCECEEWKQAWQLGEVLRRSGVDCWLQRPREFGVLYARVWVAADQLERARAISDQPIPQDIIDESNEQVPEYEISKCPQCGAEDPTLEAVDPANRWLCEQCGAEWSDPAEVAGEKQETP
jgi:hypothetical protein